MNVLQEVSEMCRPSSKLAFKERVLVESMMWLVEAKVKIASLIESATRLEPDSVSVLKDSPDTPLELAVASVRNVVGVVHYVRDPSHPHSE